MERRKFLKTGAGVAGFGLIAGCIGGGDGGADGGATSTPTSPVTIGALEPLSGNFTPWGQAHLPGLEFAVSRINADGGVMGRELEIVSEDTESDASSATTIFERFDEQDDIAVATGPVSSDVGIRTSRTAEDLEIPLFLHMAGSDAVISRGDRYTFRVGILPATPYAGVQSQIVQDRGYSRVGAIIGDYAWGQSVKSSIEENFETDVQIETAPVGASDFKPFIRQFPQDLEMMIASGHPPGTISIFGQMRELGYEPGITTDPGLPPGVIWGALGETATQGMAHNHLTDIYSEEFRAVASAFAEANDARMDTHGAYGYVTGQLIAAAIEEAGSAEPPAIADALRTIELDTVFANPIQYTEYGELDDQRYIYSQFEAGAPDYYGDGAWRLTEFLRTDPIPAFDPG